MSEPSTPLMRQYSAIKKEHPNALLFFRLGDFYELFFDDAILAARELQITLTSRNKEKGVNIPMCGVPYHAAEGYIAKLIRRGFKVAVCEQVEDPRLAKTLVRREVTRVVTPGTAADSSLSPEENNFLAAVATVGDRVGFAALDLSTGEFRATEFAGEVGRDAAFKKNLNNCAQKKCCTALPPRYSRIEIVQCRASLRHAPARPPSLTIPSESGPARPPGQPARGRNSARRLDLRSRPRDSAPRKSFRRPLARGLRPGRQNRRRLRPPERSSITSAPRSAARSITSTASASTSARIAWSSTPSPCATSN